jgi:syntaxin-binding protein 1
MSQVLPLGVVHDSNRVAGVDNIEKQRDRNPSFEALYILHPNRYNIETIIRDFIDPQNKHYAAAHIRFISSVDNKTIAKISNSPIRPIIRSLIDLNLDFNPIESMVFSTRTPESFQVLYNASCRALVDSELVLISKKVSIAARDRWEMLMGSLFLYARLWEKIR